MRTLEKEGAAQVREPDIRYQPTDSSVGIVGREITVPAGTADVISAVPTELCFIFIDIPSDKSLGYYH